MLGVFFFKFKSIFDKQTRRFWRICLDQLEDIVVLSSNIKCILPVIVFCTVVWKLRFWSIWDKNVQILCSFNTRRRQIIALYNELRSAI